MCLVEDSTAGRRAEGRQSADDLSLHVQASLAGGLRRPLRLRLRIAGRGSVSVMQACRPNASRSRMRPLRGRPRTFPCLAPAPQPWAAQPGREARLRQRQEARDLCARLTATSPLTAKARLHAGRRARREAVWGWQGQRRASAERTEHPACRWAVCTCWRTSRLARQLDRLARRLRAVGQGLPILVAGV